MALLSTVIILTGCEKKEPEYKIQIINNHDLIPGQHWQLSVLKLEYAESYFAEDGWRETYETLNNTEIQWEVESPEIVSVDSCGVVTAHEYGESRVTAYYAPYNSTYTTTIKVGKYLDFRPIYGNFSSNGEFCRDDSYQGLLNQLIEQGVDRDHDNMISEEEIHAVEQLHLSNVSSTYIEVCTNIKRLDITIKENFEMHHNTKLEYVKIFGFEAGKNVNLDFSSCSELRYLELIDCKIVDIDLSGCSKLEYLDYRGFLDYRGGTDEPYTFDCRNCPNLLYVNINKAHNWGAYYNKNSIRLDPFFHHYYSQNPQRERTQAEKDELAYNGGLSELFPWSSNLDYETRNVLVNYEWYFNATLIQ